MARKDTSTKAPRPARTSSSANSSSPESAALDPSEPSLPPESQRSPASQASPQGQSAEPQTKHKSVAPPPNKKRRRKKPTLPPAPPPPSRRVDSTTGLSAPPPPPRPKTASLAPDGVDLSSRLAPPTIDPSSPVSTPLPVGQQGIDSDVLDSDLLDDDAELLEDASELEEVEPSQESTAHSMQPTPPPPRARSRAGGSRPPAPSIPSAPSASAPSAPVPSVPPPAVTAPPPSMAPPLADSPGEARPSLPPRPDASPSSLGVTPPAVPEGSVPEASLSSVVEPARAHVAVPAATELPQTSAESAPTSFAVSAPADSAVSLEDQVARMKAGAQSLVDMCETQLRRKPDKHRAARLYYEVARLYETPLGDLQAASKNYEAAQKIQPDSFPTVRGLRRVQTRLNRFPQALSTYKAEAKLSSEPSYHGMLLYGQGCLLEGKLGQKAEAREAFEEAAQLMPTNPSLLKAAAHSHEQALAWQPLVATFERLANALFEFPEQQSAYLSQMARTVAVRLKDVPRAIEIYKSAVAIDPRAPGALSALKELLLRSARWGELVGVHEKESQLAQDLESRALAMVRVGRLQVERLGDLDAGLKALEHASSMTPADATILQELARVYELAGRDAELTSAQERLLSLVAEPTAEQFFRLGQLYDERLSQPEYAIERYSRALAVEPDYKPALLSLERLRIQRGEWSELAQMLAHQANSSVDSQERAVLLCRIAFICEERLGALQHAIDHHKKAMEASPGHVTSFKALVRLLTAHNKWHELVEIFERHLEQELSSAERIATLFKLGRIEEDALALPAAAVTTYKRILEVDADHLEAIEALQRAAERGGRFEELVLALELEASKMPGTPRRFELLQRAAEVADEELSETPRAVAKLTDILEEDAKFRPAITKLIELFHRDGQYEELAGAYGRELAVTREAAGRSKIHFKMAEVYERNLGNLADATKQYRKAVQAQGKNIDAVRALRRLLTNAGDFKEVVQLLEQELQQLTEPAEIARLWYFAGELYENRLEAPEKALASYKSALEASPAYRPATDGVARILEQKRDYKALRGQLEQEAQSASESFFSIDATYRLGELSRDHLKKLSAAAEAFEAVLEQDAAHVGALLSLERLYAQLDNEEALALVYQKQAMQLKGVASQVAAYRSWLRLIETGARTPDIDTVKQAYTAILNLAPGDVFALFALEATALEVDDKGLLAQVDAKLGVAQLDRRSTSVYQTRLADLMAARGDHSALEVYRAALSHDGDNIGAARGVSILAETLLDPALLTEAADNESLLLQCPGEGARLLVLAAGRLVEAGDYTNASARLTTALQMDPDNAAAAQSLTALHADGQGDSAGFLVDAIARAAGQASSPDARAEMWLKVAHLHAERTKDNGAAIAAASRAVREHPADGESRMFLAELHARGGAWKESVAQLQELLKRQPSEALKLKALLQLAAVQNDKLGKPAPAEGHAQAALVLSPDNREALSVLLRVQIAREQTSKAAETAERLAQVSNSPEERAEALHQSAKLELHRSNLDKAQEAYVGAVSILGAVGEAATEFRQWLEQRGASANWREYCGALTSYIGRPDLTPEQQRAAFVELGRAMDLRLGDTSGGLEYLRAALQLAPDDDVLRTEIAQRLEKLGQLDDAASFYLDLVRLQPQYSAHWRALATCYERLVRLDLSRLALAPVIAHGEATVAEVEKYESTPARPEALAAAALSVEVQRELELDVPVVGAGQDLLRAALPAIVKLFPAPLERLGLSKNDKVGARSNNALRHVADKVAATFGIAEFELYVHESQPAGVTIGLSEHPAILASSEVSAYSELEQIFLFAHAMANMARGLSAVDALGDADVTTLIVALGRQQSAAFAQGLGDSAQMEALPKRVSKAMPWFTGGKLDTAAKALVSDGVDVRRWLHNVHVTAYRAGVVACDDLAAALRCMERQGVDPSIIQDVVGYTFTEPAAELRRRLM